MSDLVTGLGLALVIEGVLWGLFPSFATRLLMAMAALPEQSARMAGVAAVAVGGGIVWLVRG